MEKIKHIMHPGKEKDDEVLYGSGRTTDPVRAGDTAHGHHVDPLAGNVNKPLPHTPASFVGAPGTGATAGVATGATTTTHHHSHGTHDDTHVGEVRPHYHLQHDLHLNNPPPLADPRIGEVLTFGHTPVEALRAAIEAPVPTILDEIPVTGGTPLTGHGHTHSPTTGPHNSSLMNKMDPRVDSNNDGSRPLGGHVPGTHPYNPTHTSRTIPVGTGIGGPTPTSGPHATNLANKLDPRVDSDRDGSTALGGTTHHPGRDAAVLGGATATGAAGYGLTGPTSGPMGSSTTGPYSSTTGVNPTDPYHQPTDYRTTDTTHHHHTDDKHHHDDKHKNTGFLDLLHRNKDTHHDNDATQQPYSTTGAQQPYSTTGTTGTTGVGSNTYDNDHHERHRLHKDPPKELLEQEGLITSGFGTAGSSAPTYNPR